MPELSEFQKFMSDLVEGKPTFLLATTVNCPPCEAAKPQYEAIKEVFAEQASFYQIDVTDLPTSFMAARRIRSAPTLMMFRFGVEENRLTDEKLKQMGAEIGSFIDEFATQNAGATTTEFECEACQ